ncbi:16S rRNA (cytosine(1407)-C(5))-methyltransferase RsmF, partial [Candidatus Woesearchaeota archaeon CG_4_10_14_0_8_um_filter_47_5]
MKGKRTKHASEQEVIIKPGFEAHYRKLLGARYEEFIASSLTFLRRSIRVNGLKIKVGRVKERLEDSWVLDPVPWCPEGFWIRHREGERRDIGNLPEHSLGYF